MEAKLESAMMTVKIARNSDPFKKYWWVILLGFGGVGAWICMPLMDSSVGAGSVNAEAGLRSAQPQSLDSINNPSGAPGGVVNLLMEGSGRYKKKDGPAMSSLYQAPEEPAAAAAAAPATGNLADALKDIASRTAASGAADSTGWGGQKAQRGFVAPRANFGAMSGFSSGSGSGASASSAGGGAASVSGFGAQRANTGVAYAQGLRDDSAAEPGRKGTFGALQGAQAVSIAAARQHTYDVSAAMGGRSFDGSGGKGSGIGGGGAGQAGSAGLYGSLDSAPINLKANDPNLNQMKIEAPPALPKEVPPDPNDQMRQMLMQMIIMGLVGGLMGGVTGGIGGIGGIGG